MPTRVAELRTARSRSPELERALERVEALSARVQKALDLPGGLSVAQAAERLEVSEPTIRKWLAEGLLERVEGHKPVEISQRSVIEVERVLGPVRESYRRGAGARRSPPSLRPRPARTGVGA